MEQRDYFEREIEKLVLLLVSMTGKILGFGILTEQAIKEIESELDADLNFSSIMNASNDELELLLKQSGYNEQQLESVATVIMELGLRSPDGFKNKQHYLEKALYLFNYLNQISKVYSLSRQNSIDRIINSTRPPC